MSQQQSPYSSPKTTTRNQQKKKIQTNYVQNFYRFWTGAWPDYISKVQPGKMEDLTKESYEWAQFQGTLFTGTQFNYDVTPIENLKILTNIRAGTPGKDASFSTSAICLSNNYFIQAQWDGVSTSVARTRVRLFPWLDFTVVGRVGSDYSKNFVAECGVDLYGHNYTVEFQYEGSQENIVTASYTQSLYDRVHVGTAFIYSLTQKSSILSLAAKLFFEKMHVTGSIILPQIPNTNLLLPNRITLGTAMVDEQETFALKYASEFQLNPSEETGFDSIVVAFMEKKKRGSSIKVGVDSLLRFSVLYEENEPVSVGSVTFSALVDYLKKDYKFGFGFTLQQ